METTYTAEEILKAAEIGEVSSIDAKHIVSLLPEARRELQRSYSCETCKHFFENPFDQGICRMDYVLEIGDCAGKDYERTNS